MRKQVPFGVGVVIAFLALAFVSFYPLDYYVMKPGSAYDIAEYVAVANADRDDEGTFNMMTVSMSKASPLTYVYAQFKDYYELLAVDDVRQEEEDEEEYTIRQNKLMTDSQFNALYMAFSKAQLDYEITYKGVYVLNIISGSAADGILKPGDEIVEIDGEPIDRQEKLAQHIEEKRDADQLELVVNRQNKLLTKHVVLKEIPGSDGRIGLGITFVESKTITTEPHVDIKADGIGGPSAGLMFTLEILNQLMDEDLTKGYTIAGTGEMLEDGTVGRIGGVEKKVVAAHEAGMEIFFVPNDEISSKVQQESPEVQSNYEAASATAEKIGATMKIVPVKTLQDALAYLESLEPKK